MLRLGQFPLTGTCTAPSSCTRRYFCILCRQLGSRSVYAHAGIFPTAFSVSAWYLFKSSVERFPCMSCTVSALFSALYIADMVSSIRLYSHVWTLVDLFCCVVSSISASSFYNLFFHIYQKLSLQYARSSW